MHNQSNQSLHQPQCEESIVIGKLDWLMGVQLFFLVVGGLGMLLFSLRVPIEFAAQEKILEQEWVNSVAGTPFSQEKSASATANTNNATLESTASPSAPAQREAPMLETVELLEIPNIPTVVDVELVAPLEKPIFVEEVTRNDTAVASNQQQSQPVVASSNQSSSNSSSAGESSNSAQGQGGGGEARLFSPSAGGGRFPQPNYPESALRRGQSGRALVFVEVDANGRPKEIRIRESSGHAILDREARRALRRWRWNEGPARYLVPINFILP